MANRYILFFKPYDVLSTFTDPEGRQTLGTYVTAPGVYAAGRLDQDSEGLMLLTDDGRLAHVLTDPDHKLPKTYFVQIENEPDKAAISQLRRGVVVKGETTLPAEVDLLDDEPDLPPRSVPIRYRPSVPTRWLRIVLREGRKRQIRHMTAAVGHPTLRLIRVAIGPLTLRGLQPGQWRDLTPEELETLRNMLGLTRPGKPEGAEPKRAEGARGAPGGPRRAPPGEFRGPRPESQRGRPGGDRRPLTEDRPRAERGARPEREQRPESGPGPDRGSRPPSGGPARPARSSGAGMRRDDRGGPPRRGQPEQEGPRRPERTGYDADRPGGPRAGRGPQPPAEGERDSGQRGRPAGGGRPQGRQGPRTGEGRPGDRGPRSGGQRPDRRGPGGTGPRPDNRGPKPTGQGDRREPRREERPEPRREERPEPQRQERRPEPRRDERPEPPRQERRPEPGQADRTRTRPPGGPSRSIGQRPKRRTS